MTERVQWITYQGKPILQVDYSNLRDEEEYLQVVDEFEAEVLKHPRGKQMRAIVDVTGSILTPSISDKNKEVAAKAKELGIPDSPTAMVGLSGFKMAVAQALAFFRPDLYIADSRQAALNWLLAQEIKE
ncbi:MAG: hypothetical protein PVF47_15630 [Anaerolineae bacterium]|jgi:hypothetical protein